MKRHRFPLIITGSTWHDSDFFALTQLAAEWGQPDADFTTRVQHFSGELGGGYNDNAGAVLRPGDDVFNDYSVDQIDAGTGADWVFLSVASSSNPFVLPDVLTDQDAGALVTLM